MKVPNKESMIIKSQLKAGYETTHSTIIVKNYANYQTNILGSSETGELSFLFLQ